MTSDFVLQYIYIYIYIYIYVCVYNIFIYRHICICIYIRDGVIILEYEYFLSTCTRVLTITSHDYIFFI